MLPALGCMYENYHGHFCSFNLAFFSAIFVFPSFHIAYKLARSVRSGKNLSAEENIFEEID